MKLGSLVSPDLVGGRLFVFEAATLTGTGNLSANVEVYDSIVKDNQKTFAVTNALWLCPDGC